MLYYIRRFKESLVGWLKMPDQQVLSISSEVPYTSETHMSTSTCCSLSEVACSMSDVGV